jgi:hypothetical protein
LAGLLHKVLRPLARNSESFIKIWANLYSCWSL